MRNAMAALAGAVVMFVLGFLFWGIGPMLCPVLLTLDAESEGHAAAIAEQVPKDGVYVYPFSTDPSEEAQQAVMDKMSTGPMMMIHIHKGPTVPYDPRVMLKGFLHMLASCLLAVIFLGLMGDRLDSFKCRLGFFAMFGLVSAFWSEISRPIWWQMSWHYYLYYFVYSLLAWVLAGLAMAAILRSRAARS